MRKKNCIYPNCFFCPQITVGDGLPEKICVECAGNASKFYLFKKKCEETDRALRSRFGKSPYSSPKWVQETPLPSKEPEIVNTIIIKPELSDYNHQDESDQEELEENTKTIKTNNNQNDEGALRQGLKHEEPEIEIMDASFSGNDDCESESEWDDIHVEKNTTGKVKNFFECDECPKIFTKADLLSQHQHNYHFKVESIKFEEQVGIFKNNYLRIAILFTYNLYFIYILLYFIHIHFHFI